jgi:hypothetical protein
MRWGVLPDGPPPQAPHPAPGERARASVALVALAALGAGCDQAPHTAVVLDDAYPASASSPLVVYRAYWQAVAFPVPIAPGSSSDPQPTVPASDNLAYVLVAPGWDPDASATPSSLVVLQSRSGFGVHFNDTLHIPVSDATFAGDCASGSPLTQDQADFITQRIFPCDFAALRYDAASCTTTPIPDADASCDAY